MYLPRGSEHITHRFLSLYNFDPKVLLFVYLNAILQLLLPPSHLRISFLLKIYKFYLGNHQEKDLLNLVVGLSTQTINSKYPQAC